MRACARACAFVSGGVEAAASEAVLILVSEQPKLSKANSRLLLRVRACTCTFRRSLNVERASFEFQELELGISSAERVYRDR